MASNEYNTYITLCNSGNYKEAAFFAEQQAVATGYKNEFWLTQEAKALLHSGNHTRAYEIASKAVQIAPANSYALCVRADAALKLGKYKNALDDYSELLSSEKLLSNARKGVLSCLEHLGNKWQQILNLINEWNLPYNEMILWKVKAYKGLKRSDDALAECQEWLKRIPHNKFALKLLVELEIEKYGLEPVMAKIGKMAKISSLPPIYAEIYASLCKKAGKTEAALDQYKKLTISGNDPWIMRQQVFLLARTGHESEALPLLEEQLRMHPQDKYLHKSYKSACKRINRIDRAISFLEELITLFPEDKKLLGRVKNLKKVFKNDG